MSNFIDHITIENFKSIQSCHISDYKRINLFIGRPNVGKSNILEALSLFSIPFLRENTSKKLSSLIRLEHETELFYNGNKDINSMVYTNTGQCGLGYHPKEGLVGSLEFNLLDLISSYNIKIDEKLNVDIKGISDQRLFEPPVKRYSYKPDIIYKKGHAKYLIPPSGYNLLYIIENYSELRDQVRELFKRIWVGNCF